MSSSTFEQILEVDSVLGNGIFQEWKILERKKNEKFLEKNLKNFPGISMEN